MRCFRLTVVTFAFCAGLLTSPAFAEQGADLVKAKGCLGCHAEETSAYGPPFRDIARRFAGLKNAKSMLSRLVITGTDTRADGYHWAGGMNMPPGVLRDPVSVAEADAMIDYILTLY